MTGKAYEFDLEMVAQEAGAYAKGILLAGDGRDAWVFDVDETLLSNLPYYADHQYGSEVFDGHQFDRWVEKARAPAIEPSLKLYNALLELGLKIILLTGRSEAHRSVTVDNLERAGFQSWDKLLLRFTSSTEEDCGGLQVPEEGEIVGEGYRILGNSGDQWSDLVGLSTGERSFKLPNAMYYIP
ncbi:unnamed protein product [Spirodela intermedia]|uniref:Uncharacterized protein n=1 Tax=Spirodela intermedia TaxID=51605 RepID=A0A7I8IGR9_SPIIN|nr:unnamed protein product [Spirodela intermedia]CAA6657069.1 unnamed protein product [Spirodela intermedia]